MITIDNLHKTFGRTAALRGVSLNLEAGRCVALIGPNGSGKTTLLKCILGLVRPDRGEVKVRGESAAGHFRYRRHVGYMPQVGRYPDQLRVRQVIDLIRQVRGTEAAGRVDEELIGAFGLDAVMGQRMHTLSGGTRQKVSAAIAFLFDPPVLILDEPTAGLDPEANERLKDKVRRQADRGRLVIITSHVLSELDEIASDVLYLHEGAVQFYQTMEALKRETRQERLSQAIVHLLQKNKIHE